jgi:hypothetical protein
MTGDYVMPPMSVLILQYGSTTTGITESKVINEIVIFPNPASNEVMFKSKTPFQNRDKITIYNSLGAVVGTFTNLSGEEFHLDTHTLSDGLYTIQLESEKNSSKSEITYYKKIIMKNKLIIFCLALPYFLFNFIHKQI